MMVALLIHLCSFVMEVVESMTGLLRQSYSDPPYFGPRNHCHIITSNYVSEMTIPYGLSPKIILRMGSYPKTMSFEVNRNTYRFESF